MAPGNKRNRSKLDNDDDKSGPSKVQLRGLSWNEQAAKPAFLQNALAALQGPRASRAELSSDGSGRPAIPERPEGDRGGDESEEDEWDLARGDEAPAVVVLKEGKHIDRDEVDRIRREGEHGSCAGSRGLRVFAQAHVRARTS